MDVVAIEFFFSPIHFHGVIYVLAYPSFEPSSTKWIADFRAIHEPQRAKLVPPHVTLVFGVTETHLQAVGDLVEVASNQTRAFRVSFDRSTIEFDPFEKKYKIFLLCGDGSGKVTSLHNRLYEGAHRSQLGTARPFKPHMTLATYDTRVDLEQVEPSIAARLPINAELRSLEMVRFADGKLTPLKTVSFLSKA